MFLTLWTKMILTQRRDRDFLAFPLSLWVVWNSFLEPKDARRKRISFKLEQLLHMITSPINSMFSVIAQHTKEKLINWQNEPDSRQNQRRWKWSPLEELGGKSVAWIWVQSATLIFKIVHYHRWSSSNQRNDWEEEKPGKSGEILI